MTNNKDEQPKQGSSEASPLPETAAKVRLFNDEALLSLKKILAQVEEANVQAIEEAQRGKEDYPEPTKPQDDEELISKEAVLRVLDQIYAFPGDHVPRDVVKRILSPLLGLADLSPGSKYSEVINNRSIKQLEELLTRIRKRNQN